MGFYINIIFALLFIWFVYFYVKQSFALAFLYGLIFYQAFSIIPSLIYIEQGIYINEQGRYSFFSGATIACVLYYIFTFVIIAMAFKSFDKKQLPIINFSIRGKTCEVKLLVGLVLFVQLLLLLNAALSPLPILDSSIDKFTYWSNSRLPFLNKIFGNTAMFLPFTLGVLFNQKLKKFSLFMLLVYFLYNFSIGQKFSPIIQGTFSFLLPIVYYNIGDLKKLVRKSLLPFLFFAAIIGPIIYGITYTKYEDTKPFADARIWDPNEAILYRIFGLQGHLFWGATERFVVNSEEPKSFNPGELLNGMPVMMKEFAKNKKGVLNANNVGGYNFTNAYPGILFKIFPFSLALVAHTLFAIFFLALMGWILKEFLTRGGLLLSVITYQLFNWVIYAFTMGYFYKLYFSLFFMIVYGIYVYIRNKRILNVID